MEENDLAYIRTYSGGYFYPAHPELLVPRINDIAHALSRVCRYNGHLWDFYSVAQHSLLVEAYSTKAMLKENPNIEKRSLKKFSMQALLHDASEAYLPDMPSPVKQFLPDFKVLEKKVMTQIFRCFDVPENIHAIIKEVDRDIRILEMRYMQDWKEGKEVADLDSVGVGMIHALLPHEAKDRFLARYYQIGDVFSS